MRGEGGLTGVGNDHLIWPLMAANPVHRGRHHTSFAQTSLIGSLTFTKYRLVPGLKANQMGGVAVKLNHLSTALPLREVTLPDQKR